MVMFNGEFNYVGIMLMGYCCDMVYVFSCICSQFIEKVKQYGDFLVLMFGKVELQLNMVNVVSGKIIFIIDCWYMDVVVFCEFIEQLENDMCVICDEMDISIDIDLWMDEVLVLMNVELVVVFIRLCEIE